MLVRSITRVLVLSIIASLALCRVGHATTYTFGGATPGDPTPGDTASWFNAKNWRPNGVPGAADTAVNTGFPVSLDGSSVTVSGLQWSGDVQSGSIQVTSDFEWSAGTVAATVNIPAGGVANITGTADKVLNGVAFNNAGVVNWSGTGRINGGNSAAFNNQSGGVFNAQTDGQVFVYNFGGQPTFNNLSGASFNKSGGAAATAIDSWIFNNAGAIGASAGELNFNTTATYGAGSAFVGAGASRLVGGNVTLAGIITAGGNGGGGNLEVAGANVTGGTGNGTDCTLTRSGSGLFTWSSGNLLGTINLAAATTLNISGTADKAFNLGTFNNAGTVNWSGTGRINGGNSAVFNNQAGSTFNAQTDGQVFIYNFGGQPTFNNLAGASFNKSGGTGVTTLDSWIFNDTGTVKVPAGTLDFNATLSIGNGAVFAGVGRSRLTGGAVSIAGHITAGDGATVELGGGSITGNQANPGILDRSSTGVFQWTAGNLLGSLRLPASGRLDILGTADKALNGATFDNAGLVNWSGTGRVNGGNSAVFNNQAGGSFNLQTDGQVFIYNFGGQPAFNNLTGATINKHSTGTTSIDSWLINAGGTVNATAGVLTFNTALHLDTGATFTGAGHSRINGGNIRITNTLRANSPGALEFAGGSVTGATADLVSAGSGYFIWSAGNILGTCSLHAGSRLDISGTADKAFNGGTFNNAGTVNWSGTGRINGGNSAVFNNQAGSTFNAQTDGQVFVYNFGGQPTFNNLAGASFNKTGGTGVTALDSWIFSTGGLISVRAGTITFNTTQHLNNGASFAGAGRTRLIGGNTTVSGTATVANGATVEVAGGNITGNAPTPGTLSRSGTGLWRWTAGSLLGSLQVATGGQLDVVGTADKTLNGTDFGNRGTVNWTGTGRINGGNSAVFTNRAGGVLNTRTAGQLFIYNFGGRPAFNNQAGATFNSTSAGTTDASAFDTHNDGTINVTAGSLSLGNFVQTAGRISLNGNSLSANNLLDIRGGTVSGGGTITADVSNAGTLMPGPGSDILTINGNYTQTPTGVLAIAVGGTTPGTNLDQLVVTGRATLKGQLNASLTGAFRPSQGQTFTFLRYGSRIGSFTSVTGASASFHLLYAASSASLQGAAVVTPITISGHVTTSTGAPLAGVRVTRDGNATPAFTDASGLYTLPVTANGLYTVTPSLSGYTFTPEALGVKVGAASAGGINFTARPSAPRQVAAGLSSAVALSTVTASAATDSVRLRFSATLDAESASNPAHYTVEINGRAAEVESASYNASAHLVTLGLPTNALHPADQVRVHCQQVLDVQAHAVYCAAGVTAR